MTTTSTSIHTTRPMLRPVMGYWGSEIQTLTLGAQLTNVTNCHWLLGVRDTDTNIGGSANQCYDLSWTTGGQIQTLTLGAQLTNVMTCHGLLGVRDTDSNTGGSANPAAQPAESSSVMLMQTIGPPNLYLTHQVTTSNAQVAHSAQRSTSCGA